MRDALAEARLALPAGDVPIGAVVLDAAGSVVARGHNVREALGDPTGHAEVVALREAAAFAGEWRLSGHTLVVTLEPCTMCAGAAVLARVDRVVFGAYDDKAGAVGSLWDVVRDRRLNHRPEVVGGVLAEESAGLLDAFFEEHRGGEFPRYLGFLALSGACMPLEAPVLIGKSEEIGKCGPDGLGDPVMSEEFLDTLGIPPVRGPPTTRPSAATQATPATLRPPRPEPPSAP